MATAVRDRARSSSAPGSHADAAIPASRPRRNWPAGLIGAVGLIALTNGLIASDPGEVDAHSRLGVSWQSAYHGAAGDPGGAEILCFGDSLVKLGMLPRVLESRLGESAYNLAVLGGQPPSGYFLLRRVLASGHRPRALIVHFSPLLLDTDPRLGLEWWAALPGVGERLELAWRGRDAELAASLVLHGAVAALSGRDTFRTALGLAAFPAAGADERLLPDELMALRRNWRLNRGARSPRDPSCRSADCCHGPMAGRAGDGSPPPSMPTASIGSWPKPRPGASPSTGSCRRPRPPGSTGTSDSGPWTRIDGSSGIASRDSPS